MREREIIQWSKLFNDKSFKYNVLSNNLKNIKFSEIDVSNDEALREKMTTMANGARSVPQIFADNVHIGDCDKIYKLDQEKKLDKLLGLE